MIDCTTFVPQILSFVLKVPKSYDGFTAGVSGILYEHMSILFKAFVKNPWRLCVQCLYFYENEKTYGHNVIIIIIIVVNFSIFLLARLFEKYDLTLHYSFTISWVRPRNMIFLII